MTPKITPGYEKEKEDEETRKKPRALRVSGFDTVAWFASGYDSDTGCYFLGLGDRNQYIPILSDTRSSGLFVVSL